MNVALYCMLKGKPQWTDKAACDKCECPLMRQCPEYQNIKKAIKRGSDEGT